MRLLLIIGALGFLSVFLTLWVIHGSPTPDMKLTFTGVEENGDTFTGKVGF